MTEMTEGKRSYKVLIVLLVLLCFGVAAAIGVRLVAASMVRSDEFREITARMMERGLSHVVLRPLIHIETSDMTGLATVDLGGLEIFSSRDPSNKVNVKQMVVTPSLLSVLIPGPLKGRASLVFDDGAIISLELSAPLATLRARSSDGLVANAELQHVDAKDLGNLVLDGLTFSGVKVLSGTIDGTISFRDDRGSVKAKLVNTTFALAVDEAKQATLASTDMTLDLSHDGIRLLSPVVLSDPTGQMTISGLLKRSTDADSADSTALDLDVAVSGAPQFSGVVPRILRCKTLPATNHYLVRGPVLHTECPDLP